MSVNIRNSSLILDFVDTKEILINISGGHHEQSMADALAAGDRVEIRGLCTFYVKQYKAYTGRNPKTGEQVQIKPKKLPYFKCGKELKDRVDS